jgi:hypothetical protein
VADIVYYGSSLSGYRTAKTDNALVSACMHMKMNVNKYTSVVASASIFYHAYALARILI